MPPSATGSVMPVSTSDMAWPSAPKRPVSGSTKVSVPTPAVLERTQAPMRELPSRGSATGVSVSVRSAPSRETVTAAASPAFNSAASSSALRTGLPFTRVITSPELSPASRAGLARLPRSEVPTTTSPSVSTAMPTDCPPGISRRSSLTSTSTCFTGMPSSRKIRFALPHSSPA